MEPYPNGSTEVSSNGPHALEVVRRAEEDLAQLLRERAEVTKRIGTVKQLIAGLANLYGDAVLSDELLALLNRKVSARQRGFTEECRTVLMRSKAPQSAREVCEQVQRHAPGMMARHKDPLASVTTVLNRLTDYGEARSIIRADGRRAWTWVAEETETDGEAELPASA